MNIRTLTCSLASLFILFSCGEQKPAELTEEEEINKVTLETYNELIKHLQTKGKKTSSACQMPGILEGDARLSFGSDYSTLTVDYSVISLQGQKSSATEVGDVTNLSIQNSCPVSECKDFYDISIQGKWESRDAGDGILSIGLSKKNELAIFIFGEGWTYWSKAKVPSSKSLTKKIKSAFAEIQSIKGIEVVEEDKNITNKPMEEEIVVKVPEYQLDRGSNKKIGGLEIMSEDLKEEMNFPKAKEACAQLGNGWRLPTIVELRLMYDNRDQIGGFSPTDYWSSTPDPVNGILVLDFENKQEFNAHATENKFKVCPVRDATVSTKDSE